VLIIISVLTYLNKKQMIFYATTGI